VFLQFHRNVKPTVWHAKSFMNGEVTRHFRIIIGWRWSRITGIMPCNLKKKYLTKHVYEKN